MESEEVLHRVKEDSNILHTTSKKRLIGMAILSFLYRAF
jgi:hypothetical protein